MPGTSADITKKPQDQKPAVNGATRPEDATHSESRSNPTSNQPVLPPTKPKQ